MPTEHPVEVPADQLPPATLRAVVEDFCTRDGTDYGEVEQDLEQKVQRILGRLARGRVHLVFESTTETLRIVDEREILEVRRLAEL